MAGEREFFLNQEKDKRNDEVDNATGDSTSTSSPRGVSELWTGDSFNPMDQVSKSRKKIISHF